MMTVQGPRSKVQGRSADCAPAHLGPWTLDLGPHNERGGVLLLVLFVTAALSFVALSTALMVRTEVAATAYRLEAEQAGLLAQGAIEQTLYLMKHPGIMDAEGRPLFLPGQRRLDLAFETGQAGVVITPEAARMNVNTEQSERLQALLRAVGAADHQAMEIAEAIVDWRTPRTSDVGTVFDVFYSALPQPYRAAHRRFEHLEELLLVKGITPELFYGWMERDRDGRLVRRGGLRRALTVYGMNPTQVSLNESPYELLLSLPGMDAERAQAIVAGRREKPYERMDDLPVPLPSEASSFVVLSLPDIGHMRLTATGQPAGSATRASLSAVFSPQTAAQPRRLVEWAQDAIAEQ